MKKEPSDRKKAYDAYIASDKWREFSTDAKMATGGRCQGCDRETWDFLTYERLGNERASDLWVVCRSCHLKFHPPYKKIVNKARKKAGQRRIRGFLGAPKGGHPRLQRPKPTLQSLLRPAKKKTKDSTPWTPRERARLLREADEFLRKVRSHEK